MGAAQRAHRAQGLPQGVQFPPDHVRQGGQELGSHLPRGRAAVTGRAGFPLAGTAPAGELFRAPPLGLFAGKGGILAARRFGTAASAFAVVAGLFMERTAFRRAVRGTGTARGRSFTVFFLSDIGHSDSKAHMAQVIGMEAGIFGNRDERGRRAPARQRGQAPGLGGQQGGAIQ